jgi:undecaprenyl-diphosphatase
MAMPIADLPLLLALVLLVGVPPVTVLPLLASRAGWGMPRVRRTVWTGVGIGVALLLAQLVVVGIVELSGGRTGLDQRVLEWFVHDRDSWATGFAIVLAAAGGTTTMTLVASLATLVLLHLRQWWQAGVVAGTSAGAGLMVSGFKTLYDRQRPPTLDQLIHYHGHALPSGHALGSLVVIGVVSAVVIPALGRTARGWLLAGAAALVLGIGWCRLYLGAHWLTDVLVGWLLGGAWLAFAVTALALARRDRVAPSVESAAQVPDQHVGPRLSRSE